MVQNLGFEIPQDNVRSFIHDFRVAIFSNKEDFITKITSASIDTADIILHPDGLTSVTWSITTATNVTGGSFSIIAGLKGVAQDTARDAEDSRLRSKISGVDFGPVDHRSLDVGSMFSDSKTIIKKFDYVAIFTKDVRTNLWYGSSQVAQSSVPKDAKPKYIGLVTDIVTNYNVASNKIEVSVQFKSLARLIELTRFSVEKAYFNEIETFVGNLDHEADDVIRGAQFINSNLPPNEVIRKSIKYEYPNQLIDGRLEADNYRGVFVQAKNELLAPSHAFSNFDSKLNIYKTFANNKDFEFYSDEDGRLVWKLPTYSRKINKQKGNFITEELFNPDKPESDLRYHLHDLISINIKDSEGELVNFVSGAGDHGVIGSPDTNTTINNLQNAYVIVGGKTQVVGESEKTRGVGYKDIGLRPLLLRNALGYNTPNQTQLAQLKLYDFKVHKNNLSKGVTGTVSMIDDPYIQVGMPVVVPLFARAGLGDLKGRILPSIFYISGLSRKYEYQKTPILTLTLTHGRLIDDEYHNGVFIDGSVSPWIKDIEPTLVDGDSKKREDFLNNLLKKNTDRVIEAANKAKEKVGQDLKNSVGEVQ